MSYSSRIIEDAVEAISRLPGIGKKSALRMVLHLVKQKEYDVTHLTTTIQKIKPTSNTVIHALTFLTTKCVISAAIRAANQNLSAS